MEVIRLRQIGSNYSNWEAELDGREGNLRQMEMDLHSVIIFNIQWLKIVKTPT